MISLDYLNSLTRFLIDMYNQNWDYDMIFAQIDFWYKIGVIDYQDDRQLCNTISVYMEDKE